MDPDSPSLDSIKCCSCSGSLSNTGSLQWHRSVKRRLEQTDDNFRSSNSDFSSVARVEVENECIVLREMVSSQQHTIQELYTDLEEERNASSTAANEAMSMILRLQREKAEVQMEARQFKRYAEEKIAHDQQVLHDSEEVLYRMEQIIQALNLEIQAYKHRMLSYGFDQSEIEDARLNCASPITDQRERLPSFAKGGYGRRSVGERLEGWNLYAEEESNQFVNPEEASACGILRQLPYEYPPLRCLKPELDSDDADLEKYAAGETPQEQLQRLEYRIYQLESSPSSNYLNGELGGARSTLEKDVISQSPRRPVHAGRFSTDSSGSFLGLVEKAGQESVTEKFGQLRPNGSLMKMEDYSNTEDYSFSREVENVSEFEDDMNDRVYTIDSVQGMQTGNGSLSRGFEDENGVWLGDQDVIPQRNNAQNSQNPDCDQVGVPDYGIVDCKTAFVASEDYVDTPRESLCRIDTGEGEFKKLYMRLQALEADRESMKQAIVSMRTEKAQLILLKEIAQQLCKELSPEKRICVKKPSLMGSFSFMSVLKNVYSLLFPTFLFQWIASFVFWRRKAQRSKYVFGLSGNSVGLLLLLDKSPPMRHWRCLTRAQV